MDDVTRVAEQAQKDMDSSEKHILDLLQRRKKLHRRRKRDVAYREEMYHLQELTKVAIARKDAATKLRFCAFDLELMTASVGRAGGDDVFAILKKTLAEALTDYKKAKVDWVACQ